MAIHSCRMAQREVLEETRERLDGAVWSKAREGQNALDDGGLGWAMGKRGGSECLPQRHDADDADDGDH